MGLSLKSWLYKMVVLRSLSKKKKSPPLFLCRPAVLGEEQSRIIFRAVLPQKQEKKNCSKIHAPLLRRPYLNFFCFFVFLFFEKSEEKREDFSLNSTPPESCFVFCLSLFEN